MAKKRKSRKTSKAKAEKLLPSGFWPQVGAVSLIALGLLLVVAWFGSGGPVLEWLNESLLTTVGYATYILPLVFIYAAVEIFRAENNKPSWLTRFTLPLLVLWVAGLFGLYNDANGQPTGGFIGDTVNGGMLSLVDTAVATFIYILLIIVTLLAALRLTPNAIIDWIRDITARDTSEETANSKVMKKAAEVEASDKQMNDFKLNAGVPMLSPAEKAAQEKKTSKLSSLKGSVKQDKAAEDQAALVMATDPNWKAPSLELLEKKESPADAGDIEHNAETIRDTLHEFSIDVKMEGANIGPKVTQYTLRPPSGVKLTRITALETNLALNLAAQSLRIEAPIPGQKAVGIEVPNRKAADVRLYGVLNSRQWKAAHEPLSFAIGKDISGQPVVGRLNKMPHLLIAGQTGSGKSVMINTLLTSLLYRNSPSDMKLILVDPKQVEMAPYEDIPHLLTPVIVEPEKTISALKWATNEMERRYKLLAEERVRDITSYNQRMKSRGKHVAIEDETGIKQEMSEGKMPYIVIVIDELADLMMVAARDVEALIVRLAQKARAVGIHLVLATQRPSVDVITGLIKANVPARIAFTVASQVDSRTILDQIGAEKLLGQGDMLFKTADMGKPQRIQGAWVMDDEVLKITDHLRQQAPPQYNDEIVSHPVQLNGKGGVVMDFDSEGSDDMFRDAVRVVIEGRKASTSLLQRRLRIGYARAARIIEEMEEQGIIGPADGSRPREVLISSLSELDGDDSPEEYDE
ncbi:MAG TPA: DNA translocase FtsK 4TM domain-containing protein [Candidatus Saccharibacteria bacterium]|nr:DNA translocase FtsK 4TM domain-containing protein [Candidatus Saccharibacteria bacterium]HMR38005.1 DNA translocase FtsK 4TM domain-containing protein [Candidatus Saccharibacteria bacterium]